MTTLRFGAAAIAAGGTLFGLACVRQPAGQSTPLALSSSANALPVAVNCGPGQQALIRPAIVNGQSISQVDCVAVSPAAALAPAAAPAYPVAVSYPAATSPMVQGDIETMPVGAPVYRQASQPASARRVVYAPARRVVRPERSVKKSALIIGSSAGIGAGVGAAVGGRKGALIGAAVGGGGATLWDQLTRR
jgi:hypothetical protein